MGINEHFLKLVALNGQASFWTDVKAGVPVLNNRLNTRSFVFSNLY